MEMCVKEFFKYTQKWIDGPETFHKLSLEERSFRVGYHFVLRWTQNPFKKANPYVNFVILHKAHGSKPAYTFYKDRLEYPILCVFDNGDRFYGIKSLEVYFFF